MTRLRIIPPRSSGNPHETKIYGGGGNRTREPFPSKSLISRAFAKLRRKKPPVVVLLRSWTGQFTATNPTFSGFSYDGETFYITHSSTQEVDDES